MDKRKIKKRKIKAWDKVLEKHQKAVAKVRDNLDDDIAELEQLRENCRTAYDDLQSARDALSELV